MIKAKYENLTKEIVEFWKELYRMRTITSNNYVQEMDSVFQISLNNNYKCPYFKQGGGY